MGHWPGDHDIVVREMSCKSIQAISGHKSGKIKKKFWKRLIFVTCLTLMRENGDGGGVEPLTRGISWGALGVFLGSLKGAKREGKGKREREREKRKERDNKMKGTEKKIGKSPWWEGGHSSASMVRSREENFRGSKLMGGAFCTRVPTLMTHCPPPLPGVQPPGYATTGN